KRGEQMVMRMWKAQATANGTNDYIQHATKVVFPKVSAIERRGVFGFQLSDFRLEFRFIAGSLPVFKALSTGSGYDPAEGFHASILKAIHARHRILILLCFKDANKCSQLRTKALRLSRKCECPLTDQPRNAPVIA